MRFRFLMFLLIPFAFSCDKLNESKTPDRVYIYSNAPVKQGEKLKVWIKDPDSEVLYSLLHPLKGFTETEFTTDSATIADCGWYLASAYGMDIDRTDSIFVTVDVPSPSCNPPHNGIHSTDGSVSDNFLTANRDTTEDGFEIWVWGNNNWLFLRFKSGDIQNQSGIYASSIYQQLQTTQAYSFIMANGNYYIGESGQPIDVKIENDRMTITLCDFVVKYQSYTKVIDASVTFGL